MTDRATPSSLPVASAGHLRAVVGCIERLGAPVAGALAGSGLPALEATDERSMIPVHPLLQLMGRAARAYDVPDLGLRAARPGAHVGLGPSVAPGLATAPTPYAALLEACELVRTFSSHVRIWTRRRADELWGCAAGSTDPAAFGADQAELSRLAHLVHFVRGGLGPAWTPRLVLMESEHPPFRSLEALLGGCEVRTGAACCALPIPLSVLSHPRPRAGSRGDETTSKSTQQARLERFSDRLAAVIPPYMRAGTVSVGLVGEILRVGPRTLRRRLAAQGISDSELLEHVRFAEAERLLEATDLPVLEIGLRLGYSRAPTFVRAFQRLAGVPPGAWRSSRRGGQRQDA